MAEKTRASGRIAFRAGIAFAVLGACFGYYFYIHRFDLPRLPYPDLGPDRNAGRVEQVVGVARARIWSPSELDSAAPVAPLVPLKDGDPFLIPTFFQVEPKGRVQTASQGAWMVSLEDDGEFVLEDARTDSAGSRHTQQWRMSRGTFRAKVYDGAPGLHMLQVILPRGWVTLRDGELGMKVGAEGRGTIWVRRGEVYVFYHDGTRKRVEPGGLNYL